MIEPRITHEPIIEVGIVSGTEIHFNLSTHYRLTGTYVGGCVVYSCYVQGPQTVRYADGQIGWQNKTFDTLLLQPAESEDSTFELQEVTIGIDFHWQRRENQTFGGLLKFVIEDERLTAVNVLPLEDYLVSVISSEMSAHASEELLKAHAVISRSWALAQMFPSPLSLGEGSGVRHHTLYHVCADDHCQRYQGLTRPITEKARQAVADTRGLVLTSGGRLCDTRYSKCCGGAFEEFQYCWEDTPQPYLRKQRDWRVPQGDTTVPAPDLPDLTVEAEAERWIRSTPDAFCHTTDQRILKQVLNHYDQETTDFYRWRVEYTQEELSTLIQRRSGVDYGQIIDLVPIARGTSGRIWQLQIVGTRQTRVIGKELVIRRTLSPSHLYSSAFVVDREDLSPEGIPTRFILTGAGWGHGVGLCQIGAAVMGEQGYKYDEILKHYYVGAEIENIY